MVATMRGHAPSQTDRQPLFPLQSRQLTYLKRFAHGRLKKELVEMRDRSLQKRENSKGSVWGERDGLSRDWKTLHLLHHLLCQNRTNQGRWDLLVKEKWSRKTVPRTLLQSHDGGHPQRQENWRDAFQ